MTGSRPELRGSAPAIDKDRRKKKEAQRRKTREKRTKKRNRKKKEGSMTTEGWRKRRGPDKTQMTGTAAGIPSSTRREAPGFGPRRFRFRLTRNVMRRPYVLDGPYLPVLGQL